MQRIQDVEILLVDDNPDLLALLCQTLQGAGYTHLRTAGTCAQARAAFAQSEPGLVVLDINLPDGDGFSLFRELNGAGEIPVLFLSARDADADRLFGLGLGADDYLTKPFLTQELLLRIQLILRRVWGATQPGHLGGCAVPGGLPGGTGGCLGAPVRRYGAGSHRHRAGHSAETGGQPRAYRYL